jgi:hypothetical protein
VHEDCNCSVKMVTDVLDFGLGWFFRLFGWSL